MECFASKKYLKLRQAALATFIAFLFYSNSYTRVTAQDNHFNNSQQSEIHSEKVKYAAVESQLEALSKSIPNLLRSNEIKKAVITQQQVVDLYNSLDVKLQDQQIHEQLFLNELKKVHNSSAQEQLIYHRANLQCTNGLRKSNEGDYETSVDILTKAIEDYKSLLGHNSLAEALTLDSLGHAYLSLGNTMKAKECWLQNQRIWISLSGKKHSGYANALVFLGIAEIEGENIENAKTYLQEALPLLRKIYGARSVQYAENLVNLANVMAEDKKWSEAEALCVMAKSILEERDATNNLVMAHMYSILSLSNVAFEEYSDAEENIKKTVLLHEMYGNTKAPVMRTVLNQYASLLHKLNRAQEAKELEKRASQIPAKKK